MLTNNCSCFKQLENKALCGTFLTEDEQCTFFVEESCVEIIDFVIHLLFAIQS